MRASTSPGRPRPTSGARPPSRRLGLAGLVLALALGLGACTSSVPAPQVGPTVAKPTVEPTTPAPEPEPEPEPEVWPLTGIVGDLEERPAMSVKIENSAASRPQSGLEEADVVWEEMVEGGITRFNAVYHSVVPGELGPIRSVRPMDAAISGPLGGLMVFSGGQAQFVADVREVGLQLLADDHGDAGFFRSPQRRAPHNLYGTGEAFWTQADASHSTAPAGQLAFAEDAATASAVVRGTPATVLDIAFPSAAPGWSWAPAADVGRGTVPGAWTRDEGGVAQLSADGDPLLATNVVALRVQVVQTGTADVAGNPVPETVLVGEGPALVATGGHVIEGTWSKTGELEPVVLTDVDGRTIELAPGTTWIELVPAIGGTVAYQ
ncbi:DUF3048 domain-containing protein [Georgenia subflava]|uniref:DUF3048 domain-containing protein n=1 Tax=Georgenia subflava TaxID=1622177 RepID=A0A6N7EM72_9MICO|nr:DUF3048 domain-containing protein [Georgenia subflava]MPV38228.1 DUF3048 domain-containing protein [Georgenia subflava]